MLFHVCSAYIKAQLGPNDVLGQQGAISAIVTSLTDATKKITEARIALKTAKIRRIKSKHVKGFSPDAPPSNNSTSASTTSTNANANNRVGQTPTAILLAAFDRWQTIFSPIDMKFRDIIIRSSTEEDGAVILERASRFLADAELLSDDEFVRIDTDNDASNNKSNNNNEEEEDDDDEFDQSATPLRSQQKPRKLSVILPQTDNGVADTELMRIINEEMELRQLQTVLVTAQHHNHREVQALQRRLRAHDTTARLEDLEALETDMMALEDQYSSAAWSKHAVVEYVKAKLTDT